MKLTTAHSPAAVPGDPLPSNGALVSDYFGTLLSRNPHAHPAGAQPADLRIVQTHAGTAATDMSQVLGPSNGGFVSALFDGYLSRDPHAHPAALSTLDLCDAGAHDGRDLALHAGAEPVQHVLATDWLWR